MEEKVINAALLGLGTVGTGVYKVLKGQEEEMTTKIGCKVKIRKILVRNLEKAAAKVDDPAMLANSWEEIKQDPSIDIVIELIGGIEPARTYILDALHAGKHVVTANKDLIAVHGKELLDAAKASHVDLLFEAAVAGGIPIIRPLKQCLAGNHMSEVMGIVNGTTNFILTKMSQDNMEFKDALALAAKLGYAEADPTADIDGLDAVITEKTKLIIVNNPNNPTGVIYSGDTLDQLQKALERAEARIGHPLYVISDEPYRELVYDDNELPFMPAHVKNCLIVYSFSKSLSLPGERIGYIAVSSKMDYYEEVKAGLITTNRIGSVNAPSLMQLVIKECLNERPQIEVYDQNRKILYEHLTALGFECLKPQGAFYLFVKSPI